MSDIEARVARLERANRRYRGMLVALLVAAGAIATTAYDNSIPDVVRARRFEVIDTSGAILFEASSDADGGRAVVRRRGGGGGMLFTNNAGGALGLLSPDGKVPVRAGISPKGGLLVLTNEQDAFVLVAAADDSSGGAMILYDKNGRELWNAP